MNQNIGIIAGWIMIFSFLSVIVVFEGVLIVAASNNYVFYNLQDAVEQMQAEGVLTPGISDLTQDYNDAFYNFSFHFDDLWFYVYIIFIVSSLVVAYQTKQMNYFGFLTFIFYGTMVVMFILGFYETLTNWFKDQILNAVFPTAYLVLPKFYFYLDNIGIISLIHLLAVLSVNMFDFDFSKIFARKKQEQQAIDDEEVL